MAVSKRRVLWLSSVCVIAACGSEPRTELAGSAISADASATLRGTESVTLITGDRVRYSMGPGGPSTHVEPGPGRTHVGFATLRHRDHVLVIPNDAARLVATHQLDRTLFDVTALVESGYTDRQRDDIPLIVTGPSEQLAQSAARDGLVVDRRMPALRAVAVRQPKASPSAALATLASGAATKIWLDRIRRIPMPVTGSGAPRPGSSATAAGALGRATPSALTSDPRAVAAAPTGAGVTVAVLSTGIDAAHPDLVGKVIAAEDFTGDGLGAGDVFGLGTHGASLIAGSGLASDGAFRGVAPDARLLSGRVCRVFGEQPFVFSICLDSAMLAGLEWAVVEQHARIVDIAPGHDDFPDTDPLEAAVEQLAAQFGTLIISGAGDFARFGDAVLAEPGNTDAALSVGAVDNDGQLAVFSSRGPRLGDGAIKPDLTALGVDAVGARASGVPLIGTPIDTAYQAVSTTEAAAALAAGAAALLAEQHPDWTGAELKAGLTGAADPDPTLGVFEQGSGRLDVTRATRQPVTASLSSVSLGLVRWPHNDDRLFERRVTYRNSGASPVHLVLSAALRGPDRQPAPARMVRVTPPEIDLRPGATADVVVTVDTNGDQLDGRYDGTLVATGSDDLRIITPLAVEREVESYDLTIRTRDRDGNPAFAFVALIGLDTGALDFLDVDGEITVRRPRAPYTVLSQLDGALFMAFPRLTLDRDFVADLDGRFAEGIAIKVPGVDLALRAEELWYLDEAHRFAFGFADVTQLFSASFGPESSEVQSWAVVSTLEPFEQDQPDTVYLLAHRERGHFLTGWSEVIDPKNLARVDVHDVGHGASSWRKWATVVLDDAPQFGPLGGDFGFADYPGAFDRTEYYFGPGFRFDPLVFENAATFVDFPLNVGEQARAKVYPPGSRSAETWHRAPFGPAFAELDGNPSAQRTGDVLRVSPSMISDQGSPARGSNTLQRHDRNALFRDGVLLVEHIDFREDFFPPVTVPPGPATYRFERSMSRGEVTRFTGEPLFDLSPDVSAAWTFRSAHVDGSALLALPTLRFTPELDDDNRTAARLFLLPFQIERPVGAPTPAIADAHLEVSFDDGAHWAAVPVLRIRDQAIAIVLHPRDAAFVSLRGSARDVAGNRVEQTIIHAYALGPRKTGSP
jgi:hypothetical protein